jgi:hypothetical protein
MYGLTIYEGEYYGNNDRFLKLLFGHKHKKAVRISIDFKREEINKIEFYAKRARAGLNILDKVLFQWNLKLSSKVNRHVYAIKKSLQ